MHAKLESRDDLYQCEGQIKPGGRWTHVGVDYLNKHGKFINSLLNKIKSKAWVFCDTPNRPPYHRVRVRKPEYSITIEWVKDEGDEGYEELSHDSQEKHDANERTADAAH